MTASDDVSRFAVAKHLVGCSGLGTRVHDSGLTRRTGRITKAGQERYGVWWSEGEWSQALPSPFCELLALRYAQALRPRR